MSISEELVPSYEVVFCSQRRAEDLVSILRCEVVVDPYEVYLRVGNARYYPQFGEHNLKPWE